ncbi:MAG: carbamoyltransferase HypF [Gemmataceae bacterium]
MSHIQQPIAWARAAVRLLVRGQVQGVGFRPFVYRLACRCRLGGAVRNTSAGVVIELEGAPEDLKRFQDLLRAEAPEAATIEGLSVESVSPVGQTSFVIEASVPATVPSVTVPPDLATCAACRREVFAPADRRRDYPFTNCTACGPRYSIIESMPYDRPATAMRHFVMCETCATEYHAPNDRRFHAQPNACASCGPQVGLWDRDGRLTAGWDSALPAAAALLRQGRIVALKGMGGFQLLARADQSDAVLRLRQRKQRPRKPLAVMVSSLEVAERLAWLDPVERRLLASSRNPIVLATARPGTPLTAAVAPRMRTIGLFLPTTPLHHLLLAAVGAPVVATSGNRGAEPIVTAETEALRRLAGIADAFLVHNRPVVRRVDDSVVRCIAGRPTVLRLARGQAPLALPVLDAIGALPLLATGGHQQTALALCNGAQAVLAQHIGDLQHPDTRLAFAETARDLTNLYRFEPTAIACDLHPDYFTTHWACAQDQPVIAVQHHHAHALACMVEHNLLDREVLAVTWDGTGYGPDDTIWGGEFLRVQRGTCERLASLRLFPLPGGEAAIRHPQRIAFALLHDLLGEGVFRRGDHWTKHLDLSPREGRLLASMIRRGINTPWTSSVGRLFDAMAALVLGIREASYEGEPALWLEAAANANENGVYDLPLRQPAENGPCAGDRSCVRGDWRPLLAAVLDDWERDVDAGVIAARFHNTLAQWVAQVVARHPFRDIVLTGGCFQNQLLMERTLSALQALNRQVYTHGQVPPGDGGLAVGQLAAALIQLSAVRKEAADR